jgi:hypothetical protein
MLNLTKFLSGTLLTGVLATSIVGASFLTPRPAAAQMVIGGGGTCTPHPISYEQFIPGHYDPDGIWVPSQYVTRSRMSTECNSYNPPLPPAPPVMANLNGSWYTNLNGGSTSIVQTGPTTYRLINEQGSVSNAYLAGNQLIAPQWQVTGYLQNNDNRIAWSNGTSWTRYSNSPSFNPAISVPFGNSGSGITIRL